jgi:hypothetical protein
MELDRAGWVSAHTAASLPFIVGGAVVALGALPVFLLDSKPQK